MTNPAEVRGPGPTGAVGREADRPLRRRRVWRWLLAGVAALLLVSYVSTAVFGVQAVERAVHAEGLQSYRLLRSQYPRAADPSFRGPRFETCRAIAPGLVYCMYSIGLGPKSGSTSEALYLWNARNCRPLWSRVIEFQ